MSFRACGITYNDDDTAIPLTKIYPPLRVCDEADSQCWVGNNNCIYEFCFELLQAFGDGLTEDWRGLWSLLI
jgi:hypothetical protein